MSNKSENLVLKTQYRINFQVQKGRSITIKKEKWSTSLLFNACHKTTNHSALGMENQILSMHEMAQIKDFLWSICQNV